MNFPRLFTQQKTVLKSITEPCSYIEINSPGAAYYNLCLRLYVCLKTFA